MEKVRPPRWIGWPLQTAGDKGYSYPNVRRWLAQRGIQQVIRPSSLPQITPCGRGPPKPVAASKDLAVVRRDRLDGGREDLPPPRDVKQF